MSQRRIAQGTRCPADAMGRRSKRGAFTLAYPLTVTTLAMDMNALSHEPGLPLNMAGGRGTQIPDLRLLLAVHAARQQSGETARLMREGNLSIAAGDEPARLTLIFGGAPPGLLARRKASGAFNARVAALIPMKSMMNDRFTVAVSQGAKL